MATPVSVKQINARQMCRAYDESNADWLYITNHLGVPAVCNTKSSVTMNASGVISVDRKPQQGNAAVAGNCEFPAIYDSLGIASNIMTPSNGTDIDCVLNYTIDGSVYADPLSTKNIKLTSTLNNYLYGSLNVKNLPFYVKNDPHGKPYNYPDDNSKAVTDFEDKISNGKLYASDVTTINNIVDYGTIFSTIPTTDIPRSTCKVRMPGHGLGSNIYLANDIGDIATCATTVNQLPNGDLYVNERKQQTPLYASGFCDFLTTGVTTNIPCKSYFSTSADVTSGDFISVMNNSEEDLKGLQYAIVDPTKLKKGQSTFKFDEEADYYYAKEVQKAINGNPDDIEPKLSQIRVKYNNNLKYTPIVKPKPIDPVNHMTRAEIVAIIVAIIVALMLYFGSRQAF